MRLTHIQSFQGKAVSNCNIGLTVSSVSKAEIHSGVDHGICKSQICLFLELCNNEGSWREKCSCFKKLQKDGMLTSCMCRSISSPCIQVLYSPIYPNYIIIVVLEIQFQTWPLFRSIARYFVECTVLFCLPRDSSFQNTLLYIIFIQIQHLIAYLPHIPARI